MEAREAYSVDELCKRFGICKETAYSEIRKRRLRAVKLGAKTLILKADAETWAASLPELQLAATA
jgi:excisionase family DNA binding protein